MGEGEDDREPERLEDRHGPGGGRDGQGRRRPAQEVDQEDGPAEEVEQEKVGESSRRNREEARGKAEETNRKFAETKTGEEAEKAKVEMMNLKKNMKYKLLPVSSPACA